MQQLLTNESSKNRNNTENTLLSVILVIDNFYLNLEKCLQSILNQTISDYEIIVLVKENNFSNNEILKKYKNSKKYIFLM